MRLLCYRVSIGFIMIASSYGYGNTIPALSAVPPLSVQLLVNLAERLPPQSLVLQDHHPFQGQGSQRGGDRIYEAAGKLA